MGFKFSVKTPIKVQVKNSITYLLVCLFLSYGSFVSSNEAGEASSCNMPDFDRTEDTGIFIWQMCSTEQWFFRVSAGGLTDGVELRVIGDLRLDKSISAIEPFSLAENDLLDFSDPQNINFNLRVFASAQDGFDFQLQEGTVACLNISTSIDAPIIIGGDNIEVTTPININTVDKTICITPGIVPSAFLLLNEDD